MRKLAAAFLVSLAAFPQVIAASFTLDDVLSKIETRQSSIKSIKFDYKQEIHFEQMGTDSVVSGVALFAKPGKLQISKTFPDKQVTISDGKKLWVYNPAYGQVWEGSWKKWVSANMLPKGMLPLDNYVADLKGNFNLTLGEFKADNVTISALPKNKNLGYRLELVVSTDSWLPVKTYYYSDSARIVTSLEKPEVNPSVPDDVFKFRVPKGVDVIPFN